MSSRPIHIQRYEGRSQEETLRLFADDALRARDSGYRPADQTWDGAALLVTYQYVGAAMAHNPDHVPGPPVQQPASPWVRPGAAGQLVFVVIIAVAFLLVITLIDRGMGMGSFSFTSSPAVPTVRR
jgi:hypothetical protein